MMGWDSWKLRLSFEAVIDGDYKNVRLSSMPLYFLVINSSQQTSAQHLPHSLNISLVSSLSRTHPFSCSLVSPHTQTSKMRFSLLAFVPLALSCNLPAQSNSSTPLPFNITHGTDGPADPATTSYFINHVGLVVSNLTATRNWYSEVLGMRHVFTVDLSSEYSSKCTIFQQGNGTILKNCVNFGVVMYMGHSQAGRNGRGYQTGDELERNKNNLGGLVEFVYYKVRRIWKPC